ncbi:MAG: hypothetical protein KC729_03315 [Candidatus Eisenbacteria bacterium]|uniref:Uncharacterized protein n=1 Tax=Eiseniibacteriota bacterium TaxID=2212470 RepID=A0A956RNG8_UNCEI|nr:hypothetical protein [Candidatus Eisenbacteria bacterium]
MNRKIVPLLNPFHQDSKHPRITPEKIAERDPSQTDVFRLSDRGLHLFHAALFDPILEHSEEAYFGTCGSVVGQAADNLSGRREVLLKTAQQSNVADLSLGQAFPTGGSLGPVLEESIPANQLGARFISQSAPLGIGFLEHAIDRAAMFP